MNNKVNYEEVCELFKTTEGKRTLMREYSSKIDEMLFGKNQNGEDIHISINKDSIIVTTYQNNGYIRINYFDEYGYASGEKFEGKWNE